MITPKEIDYDTARSKLAGVMDSVVDRGRPVLVRRKNGKRVAIIAADELSGMLETIYLLKSPRNAERLLAALAEASASIGRSKRGTA